jgi:large subunit ribosomal protein L19
VKSDVPEFRPATASRSTSGGRGRQVRIQVFEGRHQPPQRTGLRATFTVRKTSRRRVERIFPLHSPIVERIEVSRLGKVRRAKLYYLRDRAGKKARIQERRER